MSLLGKQQKQKNFAKECRKTIAAVKEDISSSIPDVFLFSRGN